MKQLMKRNQPLVYLEGQKKQVRSGRLYELKMFSKHVDMLEQLDLLVDNPQPGREKVLWQDYKAGCDVLCVGARYGIEMLAMREMGFSAKKVMGIDLYPRGADVLRADMHKLPFAASSFDIVYSHHTLDHSLDPRKALAEMARVSRPGAVWVFTVPYNDYGQEESVDFDSPDEVERYLLKAKGRGAKVLYRQEVVRTPQGYVIPVDTWLPRKWANEVRLIVR
jgi:SAM-dependent methyltransferase